MRNRDMPVVSIVGRPNVGKSSLFNRAIGRRHAVVEEKEGTTRDRIEKHICIKKRNLILVDTGGFLSRETDDISLLVKKQIEKAVKSSDVLLFLCDGEQGLLPLDETLAGLLRKSGKKIILAVNKIENEKRKENLIDFYRLGLGEPFGISCLHNIGIKDLFNKVRALLPEGSQASMTDEHALKIAICGRPNVGKSSFLNMVLEEERVIVHEKAGTTRDSVDSYFTKDGIFFLLIDTAGIRHKRKVKSAVDVYSMMRARESIDRAGVALLLIDGVEGVTRDDTKIFDYIREKGIGCAIVVNKWDLVKGIETSRYKTAILRKMPEARNFPISFISAKTGRNLLNAFNLAKAIKTNSDLFIDAGTLGEFLTEISPEDVKISRRRKYPRFYGMMQLEIFPKKFLVFVDDPRAVTGAHTAFIENRLRERFPLAGVPIKIIYKRRPKKKSQIQKKGR